MPVRGPTGLRERLGQRDVHSGRPALLSRGVIRVVPRGLSVASDEHEQPRPRARWTPPLAKDYSRRMRQRVLLLVGTFWLSAALIGHAKERRGAITCVLPIGHKLP